MRFRVSTLLALAWCSSVSAQGPAETRVVVNGIEYLASFNGRTITTQARGSADDGMGEADVAELDLQRAFIQEGFGGLEVYFPCKFEVNPYCARVTSLVDGRSATFSATTVGCNTREECESFLSAVVGSGGYEGRPGAVPEPRAPVDEPVIDGSDVPDEIVFGQGGASSSPGKKSPSTGSATADDSAADPKRQAPPESERSNETSSSFAGEPALVDERQLAPYASMFDLSPNAKEAVRDVLEDSAEQVFDEWRESPSSFSPSPLNWIKFLVKDAIMARARAYFTDAVSRAMYGRNLSEMPLAFQKDLAVVTAAITRVFRPHSLSAGSEQVDSMGEFFDLMDEP